MAMEAKGFWMTPNEPRDHGRYGVRKSKGFTGKVGSHYYYRGARWHGPTNLIGRPDLEQPATRHES
jgi:hypothetical protein